MVFHGSLNVARKVTVVSQLLVGTFPCETFAARSLWGEDGAVHRTGVMRRRGRLGFIEQRQERSTPLHTAQQNRPERHTKALETSWWCQIRCYAFNPNKEYLNHTLFGISCGRGLSRHAYSTQLAHHMHFHLVVVQ